MSSDLKQLALEAFFTTVGPELVRTAAQLLGPRGIAVMPLKGVLLQRLVYRNVFRQISDVDILVPQSRFMEAYTVLKAAGFSETRWEGGGWQVAMRRPEGAYPAIDLHLRLSRTPRSRLTPRGLFQRGTRDQSLFGVPIVIPSPNDLFAHLLLHASLHWVTHSRLHHPEDFETVASVLSLDPQKCANHLREQGLTRHALLMLSLLREHASSFLPALRSHLHANLPTRLVAHIAKSSLAPHQRRPFRRRLAGLVLSPSLVASMGGAIKDRATVLLRPPEEQSDKRG